MTIGERHQLLGKDVELMETEPLAAPRSGEVGETPAAQVVQGIDAVSICEEAIDEMRTDEASATGDPDPHVTRAVVA